MEAVWAALPLDALGIGGLVSLAVLSVWRGWWVPANTVGQLTGMRDERIKELAAERDDWKARGDAQTETLRELSRQNAELLELAKTSNAFLRALAQGSGKDVA